MSLKAKHELGQNFLFDDDTIEQIASYGELSATDTVLEIGPGLGSLTSRLCRQAGRVVAVELDIELAKKLKANVAAINKDLYGQDWSDKLEIIEGDFLDYQLTNLPANYKVVANIPYNVTSKIITKLWTSSNPPERAVLLVQYEVAERLVAQPGDLSVLAIATNIYSVINRGIKVPAKLFRPAPKVDSRVVIMKRRPEPLVKIDQVDNFMAVVRAGFSEKRKKLRSSLAVGLSTNKSGAEQLLKEANIDYNKRAQQLTFEEWQRLTDVVCHYKDLGKSVAK